MADLRRCATCGAQLSRSEAEGLCPRCLMGFVVDDGSSSRADGVDAAGSGLRPGARIGSYEIVSMVGRGGMGEVYRARDARLGRDVALKVLPPDFRQDHDRMRRFEQEARAASALNHPNIITIHEIDDANGAPFIITELVDGETLRERMTRERMTASDVAAIAEQIASALAAAHDAGIIHRDIKPENVMVRRDGVVKVLDFGVAKSMNAGTSVRTSSQIVAGTLPYMSPEQALGGQLDQRSDLFSVGVLLYEMLTGPLDNILHGEPGPIGRFNRGVPAALERIVRTCLEKERERRYASARELLVDLHDLKRDLDERVPIRRRAFTGTRIRVASWTLVALVAAGAAVTAYFRGAFDSTAPAGSRDRVASVAVLPFRSLGPLQVEEYLQIGMADALITRLSGVKTLAVRPTAVTAYANDKHDPIAAGVRLRADHIVDGTIQREHDRVRVTAQLVDVASGRTDWAGTFDESFTDLFALQDTISTRVAEKLVSVLTADERRAVVRHATTNVEAYELYLRGRFFWEKRTAASVRTAIRHFEQALERDDRFALAYTGLVHAYTFLIGAGADDPQTLRPALRAAAVKAVALDDQLAETHLAMSILHSHEWNWPSQEAALTRAIELNPNYPTTYLWYGYWLSALGRQQENLALRRRAHELDPLNLQINDALADALYKNGLDEEGLKQSAATLELDPGFWSAHYTLGMFHLARGRYTDAIAAFEKSGDPASLAHAHARAGDPAPAHALLRRLEQESMQRYVRPLDFAVVHAGLGDNDRAFEWLERAFRERVVDVRRLDSDPRYAPLRGDARYADLQRRIRAAYLR